MSDDIGPAAATVVAGDLAGTLADGILTRVTQAEVDLLDSPHILVCTDPATGTTTYTGPFSNAYVAMGSLEECEIAQRTDPEVPGVTCILAPLFPA